MDGDPPPVGYELEEGDARLLVSKLGASPLPGDDRVCAFTVGNS